MSQLQCDLLGSLRNLVLQFQPFRFCHEKTNDGTMPYNVAQYHGAPFLEVDSFARSLGTLKLAVEQGSDENG